MTRLRSETLVLALVISACFRPPSAKKTVRESVSTSVTTAPAGTGSHSTESSSGALPTSVASTSSGDSMSAATSASGTSSAGGSVSTSTAVASISGTTGGSGASSATGGTFGGTASSSGITTGTSGGPLASYSEFCTTFNQDLCDAAKACGEADPAAQCGAIWNLTRLYPTYLECDAGPFWAYDSQNGAACIAGLQQEIGQASCSHGLTVQPACAAVLQPAVPYGSTCTSFGQCVGKTDGGSIPCFFSLNSCSGQCVLSNVGEPCVDSSNCAAGYCHIDTPSGGLCSTFLQPGDGCTDYDSCDPTNSFCADDRVVGTITYSSCARLPGIGHFCNYGRCSPSTYCDMLPDSGSFATCVPLSSLGDPCRIGITSSSCDNNLACFNGVCVPPGGPIGAPCSVDDYCTDGLCAESDGGYLLSIFEEGICTAYLGVGQSCTLGKAPLCQFPNECLNGTCGLLPNLGQPCFVDAPGTATTPFGSPQRNCASGDYCANGICSTIALPGDACVAATSQNCLDGYCDDTLHCAPFRPPGAACDPLQSQCSAYENLVSSQDGGYYLSDYRCEAADGGGNACAAQPCN